MFSSACLALVALPILSKLLKSNYHVSFSVKLENLKKKKRKKKKKKDEHFNLCKPTFGVLEFLN